MDGRTEEPLVADPEVSPAPVETGYAFRYFTIAAVVLVLLFAKVLFDLFVYASRIKIHSHIILIPLISAYLVYQLRARLPRPETRFSRIGILLALLGLGTLILYWVLPLTGTVLSRNDSLSLTVLSFCLLFSAIVVHFLGTHFARAIGFPLAFLVFMIPIPDALLDAMEIASQLASAEVYSWMMSLSGATYLRTGQVFALPNLTIRVAQECSGIRSSLVLFITSLIAGQMFLRSPARKALLALAVFPLGIVRNGFRIYTLSMLSAHWNPNVIHSPLHHQGGPIFFVLSLIPFFALLIFLKRTENASAPLR